MFANRDSRAHEKDILEKNDFTFCILQARVDWKIIRVVSEVVDEKLPYDKLPELRARMAEVRLDCFAFAN